VILIMPRPTKLTKEKQEEIIKLIKIGLYLNTVCECVNVDYATFRRWIQKGEKERSGIYCEFCEAVKKAESDAELRIVMNWQQHVKDDWRAAQAFLERRYPERWSRKDRHEITGSGGGPIEIEEVRERLIQKFKVLNIGGDGAK
jgi:hypothetical protein